MRRTWRGGRMAWLAGLALAVSPACLSAGEDPPGSGPCPGGDCTAGKRWSVEQEAVEYWAQSSQPQPFRGPPTIQTTLCRHAEGDGSRSCEISVKYRVRVEGPEGKSARLFFDFGEVCRELFSGISCETSLARPGKEHGEAEVRAGSEMEYVVRYGFIYYMACGQGPYPTRPTVRRLEGGRVRAEDAGTLLLDASRCPTRYVTPA